MRRTRDEFMRGLFEGRVRVGGRMGSFSSMGSDVFRFTGNFFLEQAATDSAAALGLAGACAASSVACWACRWFLSRSSAPICTSSTKSASIRTSCSISSRDQRRR